MSLHILELVTFEKILRDKKYGKHRNARCKNIFIRLYKNIFIASYEKAPNKNDQGAIKSMRNYVREISEFRSFNQSNLSMLDILDIYHIQLIKLKMEI